MPRQKNKSGERRNRDRRDRNRNRDRGRDRDRGREKRKRSTGKISDHFSKRDFQDPNTGDEKSNFRISMGLIGGLELLRNLAGHKRIKIVKGYINPDAEENQKAYRKNYHCKGLAAEIQIENVSLEDAFRFAEQIEEFKVIKANFDKDVLYVDSRKEDERKLLIIKNEEEISLTSANRTDYISEPVPKPEPEQPAPEQDASKPEEQPATE